jgi:hydroxyacylglutathione hydrolase
MSELIIRSFILGPLGNNSYLTWDPLTKDAAVIDPSFGPDSIQQEIEENQLNLRYILLTHAHFDHIAGVGGLFSAYSPHPQIGIHPLEIPLWRSKSGAGDFGFSMPDFPEPSLMIDDSITIQLGSAEIKPLFTPGHTLGHLVYYVPDCDVAFTGDLIFFRGVGRTDILGGNSTDLFRSIDEKILTLPPATRLLSGHGSETTVADEIGNNPFI